MGMKGKRDESRNRKASRVYGNQASEVEDTVVRIKIILVRIRLYGH